jgi:hypothetical protein
VARVSPPKCFRMLPQVTSAKLQKSPVLLFKIWSSSTTKVGYKLCIGKPFHLKFEPYVSKHASQAQVHVGSTEKIVEGWADVGSTEKNSGGAEPVLYTSPAQLQALFCIASRSAEVSCDSRSVDCDVVIVPWLL